MYTLIIIVHTIACLILIVMILLQPGRGSGLSDLFSGASTQTIFGAPVSKFLTKATSVAAVVFLLTCISLTVVSGRRGKSLLEGTKAKAGTKVETEANTEIEAEAEPQSPQE